MSNDVLPDMNYYWSQSTPSLLWKGSYSTVPILSRWGDRANLILSKAMLVALDDVKVFRLSGICCLICGFDSGNPDEKQPLQMVKKVSDPQITILMAGRRFQKLKPIWMRWSVWETSDNITISRAWAFPLDDPPQPASDPRLFRAPSPARQKMLAAALPADKIVDRGEQVKVSGSTDSAAVLMLADTFFQGWEAVVTQNGTETSVPIEPAFGNWRAVYIPQPGPYEIVFTYRPLSFHVGCYITLGALLIWLACIGFATRRQMQSFLQRRGCEK